MENKIEDIIATPKPGEIVWMIEKSINGVAHWWRSLDQCPGTHWNDPIRWTIDPNTARKYASKGAAEYVMGWEMKEVGCVATSHSWMAEREEEQP